MLMMLTLKLSQQPHIEQNTPWTLGFSSNMPVGARQRPIEKLAKAVAKCSTEVRTATQFSNILFTHPLPGFGIREMCHGGLQCRPQRQMPH